jgi:CheY-like chemotaxis protein
MSDKGCDVFIVEDDFDIREVLSELLTDEGYAVAGAANGRDALQSLTGGAPQPKLILLDLMMPVMSGSEFIAEQRRRAELAAIPVVVVSADSNLQQKAASLGANGSLRKPIEIDRLLATVKRYCQS